MGTKHKSHPDHYQTHPRPTTDDRIYREERAKVQEEGSPPVRPAKPEKERFVHAGETLDHPVAAVCTQCGAEIGSRGDSPLLPCGSCGATSFRVVS